MGISAEKIKGLKDFIALQSSNFDQQFPTVEHKVRIFEMAHARRQKAYNEQVKGVEKPNENVLGFLSMTDALMLYIAQDIISTIEEE